MILIYIYMYLVPLMSIFRNITKFQNYCNYLNLLDHSLPSFPNSEHSYQLRPNHVSVIMYMLPFEDHWQVSHTVRKLVLYSLKNWRSPLFNNMQSWTKKRTATLKAYISAPLHSSKIPNFNLGIFETQGGVLIFQKEE